MLVQIWIALTLAVSATGTQDSASDTAVPYSRDWRAAAREDIAQAHRIYGRSHPGVFDPQNPGFVAQLDNAKTRALAYADTVRDQPGYARALALFSAGLRDGHASVYANTASAVAYDWPGFTTAWRGDRLLVHRAFDSGLPAGTEVVECGGKPVRQLFEEHVFAFFGRPDEAGQWWNWGPRLFLQPQTSMDFRPDRCLFRDPDGALAEHGLVWKPAPADAAALRWDAVYGERTAIGLSEPRPGILLIGLSDFNPDAQGREAYAGLLQELGESDRLAKADAIVLDLRHNNGGSSSWSRRVAEKLWGEEAVASAMDVYFAGAQVWWSADEDSAKRLNDRAEQIKSEEGPDSTNYVIGLAARISEAHARGERYLAEAFGPPVAPSSPVRPRQLPPVYVITPGPCASACLDAVDLFTRFPGVKLIGAPTSADSNYLEAFTIPLPSGLGSMSIPRKVWIRRPRGPSETYQPDILVTDVNWSTAVFLDHIEADLQAQGVATR